MAVGSMNLRSMRFLSACALGGLATIAAGGAQANVVTYHNTFARQGAYVAPGLTQAAAANLKLDTGFSGAVSGNVYAQPLYWHPSGAAHGQLIVATESNVVSALDAVTGATLWSVQLPAAVPNGVLPCGDIDPEGITGTPVLDPASGTLYLDSLTQLNGVPTHQIFALSLTNKGATLPGWPISVDAAMKAAGASFSSATQGERSAALLYDGDLYFTFGGRDGDCGTYYGTVIQIDPATQKLVGDWQTRAHGGGIWAQGGIASDAHSLFVTTGNTMGASSWMDGEAIIRLLPGLAHSSSTADYFTPSSWQNLDQTDRDLGGTEAIPLNVPTGTGRTVPRVIAFGKDGNAYLVNRNNLGGIGGSAVITPLSNTVIITAPAVYETATRTMVAFTNYSALSPCSGNVLSMIDVAASGKTPVKLAWCGAFNGGGSPIVTTTDGASEPIVWVVGAEGDNLLHGFNATTGAVVFGGGGATMNGLHRFQTLIAAEGRLYVAGDNRIYAFTW
jgi:hypothetical protein